MTDLPTGSRSSPAPSRRARPRRPGGHDGRPRADPRRPDPRGHRARCAARSRRGRPDHRARGCATCSSGAACRYSEANRKQAWLHPERQRPAQPQRHRARLVGRPTRRPRHRGAARPAARDAPDVARPGPAAAPGTRPGRRPGRRDAAPHGHRRIAAGRRHRRGRAAAPQPGGRHVRPGGCRGRPRQRRRRWRRGLRGSWWTSRSRALLPRARPVRVRARRRGLARRPSGGAWPDARWPSPRSGTAGQLGRRCWAPSRGSTLDETSGLRQPPRPQRDAARLSAAARARPAAARTSASRSCARETQAATCP